MRIFLKRVLFTPSASLKLTYQMISPPKEHEVTTKPTFNAGKTSLFNSTTANEINQETFQETSTNRSRNCTGDNDCLSDSGPWAHTDTYLKSVWYRYQAEQNLTTLDIWDNFKRVTPDHYKLFRSSEVDDYADIRYAIALSYPTKDMWDLLWMTAETEDFLVQCTFGDRSCRDDLLFQTTDPVYGLCRFIMPEKLVG